MEIAANTSLRNASLIDKEKSGKKKKTEGKFCLFITIKKAKFTFQTELRRKNFIESYRSQIMKNEGVNELLRYEFILS